MSASSFNIFRYAADLLHVLAILFLWQKIHKTRSCSGLSLKSQILFMAVYSTRYLDLFYLRHFDFHHMYNFVMKCLFLGSQATVIYYMVNKYRSTYNPKVDNARMEFILIPCLLLSFFFLPHNPRGSMIFFIREYFWTFSILLESVAIMPQHFVLSNTGESETITTHYLFCLGLYRGFYVLNWIYRWIFDHPPEIWVILAGLLQTGLYVDFFYIYYKRLEPCFGVWKCIVVCLAPLGQANHLTTNPTTIPRVPHKDIYKAVKYLSLPLQHELTLYPRPPLEQVHLTSQGN